MSKYSKKALASKVNSVRPYKSRTKRPCDFCRRRKTCCIIEESTPCMACAQFNKGMCTFLEEPVKRTKKAGSPVEKKPVEEVEHEYPPSYVMSYPQVQPPTYMGQGVEVENPKGGLSRGAESGENYVVGGGGDLERINGRGSFESINGRGSFESINGRGSFRIGAKGNLSIDQETFRINGKTSSLNEGDGNPFANDGLTETKVEMQMNLMPHPVPNAPNTNVGFNGTNASISGANDTINMAYSLDNSQFHQSLALPPYARIADTDDEYALQKYEPQRDDNYSHSLYDSSSEFEQSRLMSVASASTFSSSRNPSIISPQAAPDALMAGYFETKALLKSQMVSFPQYPSLIPQFPSFQYSQVSPTHVMDADFAGDYFQNGGN